MARNILEDVHPPQKRSIREIQMDSDRRRRDFEESAGIATSETPSRTTHKKIQSDEISSHEKYSANSAHTRKRETRIYSSEEVVEKKGSRKGAQLTLWLTAVACLLIVFYLFSLVFAGATLTTVPKEVTLQINATLTASKNTSPASDLPFQVITLSQQSSRDVFSTGQKDVEAKARGKIIVYNNNSSAPQRLVKNTRFQTPDGLIFRILAPIVVPGKNGSSPGSIEVSVTADQVGPQYNIGPKDFTLPGFKTNPIKYKNIYARSSGAMTGGSSGMVAMMSDSDLHSAQGSIESDLETALLKEAQSQTPDQYVLFPNATFYHFDPLPLVSGSSTKATVSEKGTLNALIFNKAALAMAIAKKSLASYDGKEVYIPNIENLVFSIQKNDPTIWQNNFITFTISGQNTLIWKYSVDNLRNDLIGKNASDVPKILNNFPEISKTELVIRPFWKNSFPDDPRKITIINKP